MSSRRARTYVGISGHDYPRRRGVFYPEGVPKREWLAYASQRFNSIEVVYFDNDAKWMPRTTPCGLPSGWPAPRRGVYLRTERRWHA